MSQSKCLAVMYHYVRDSLSGPEGDIRGVEVAAFERQLDGLCADLTPIDWPTLVAWRAGRATIPHASLLVTFDDGLSDHAETVWPILESRGIRGVFFVSTGVLVEGRMDTAHQIHLLLCRLGDQVLRSYVDEWLSTRMRGFQNGPAVDPVEAGRVYHYESPERAQLKYLLTRVLPLDVRRRLIDELFASYVGDSQAYASRWYMQWDQLAALQNSGHTIGGHSHQHLPYTRLSRAERADDMRQCAAVLGERLGRAPRPFSYPYGDLDANVARCCAEAGFVNGFTTQEDWIGRTDDGHCLGRVDTIHVDVFMERELLCKDA